MIVDVDFVEQNCSFDVDVGSFVEVDNSTEKLKNYYNKKETDSAIARAVNEIELTPGPEGPRGEKGDPGYTPIKNVDYFDGADGKDGVDGYTPIKGVDYFDGKDGAPGVDGQPGKDGYTPVKGVDYFDGEPGADGKDGYTPQKNIDYFDGKDGEPGKDGVSCTHEWNGTVLKITSASGTSEVDLKGEPGQDGIDGKDGKDAELPTVTEADNGKVFGVVNGQWDVVNAPSGGASSWNDLSDKPLIPTKTSELTNDSGFLTEHQSLTDYAKKTDVPSKTETWTFTLEDGTTVTKAVYVG